MRSRAAAAAPRSRPRRDGARPDTADRRRARFELTAAGQRVDREKRGTIESAVRRAMSRAGDTNVARSSEMLSILVTELLGTKET